VHLGVEFGMKNKSRRTEENSRTFLFRLIGKVVSGEHNGSKCVSPVSNMEFFGTMIMIFIALIILRTVFN
jgi:hypothetical protein